MPDTHYLLGTEDLGSSTSLALPPHNTCTLPCRLRLALLHILVVVPEYWYIQLWGLHCNWVAPFFINSLSWALFFFKWTFSRQGAKPQALSTTAIVLELLIATEAAHSPMLTPRKHFPDSFPQQFWSHLNHRCLMIQPHLTSIDCDISF